MSTLLHSPQNPEEICLQYSKNEQKGIYQSFENATKVAAEDQLAPKDALNKLAPGSNGDKVAEIRPSAESSPAKTHSIPETSPFKQAVRGFVLNKLSKKVGTSHLLSGISEKIVKKLEDKDNTSSLTQIEKSQTIPLIKESDPEVIPCELKSVVANDLREAASVEEAVECFEEAKGIDTGRVYIKPKLTSRSLPSSPAHTFIRRASEDILDNYSDGEEKSSVSEPLDPSTLSAKLFQNTEISASNRENEIELVNMNIDKLEKDSLKPGQSGYPENAYDGQNKIVEKTLETNKFTNASNTLRKIISSIPVLHWLLLVTILVHKFDIFSDYFIEVVFDTSIIGYISLALFTKLQKSFQTDPLYVTYSHSKLETATIDLSNSDKAFKGTVKILKGNYDADEQTIPSSELVTISIEDECLKISSLLKEENDAHHPYEIYKLRGAKVSLVPKSLPKKRIFSKKYPICITLPADAKKAQPASGTLESLLKNENNDFVPCEEGPIETTSPTPRALYFFALTSREKESWYQALTSCLKTCDKNTNLHNAAHCSISPKFDVSTMSFSSLLETNSDENLSITEDGFGNEPDVNILPSVTKLSIEFSEYMELIWENYQRTQLDFKDPSFVIPLNSDKESTPPLKNSTSVEWLNVALGRVCYDFITQKRWCDEVMVRIQRKLDKIDLPNFVEPLTVTEVIMGTSVPQIHSVSSPTIDKFGVWFDFDFTYSGSFHMTLKTRLQIPSKEKQLSSTEVSENASLKQSMDSMDMSDEESSASKRSPQHKLINKIEKWVTHKRFQSVAQSRFVKKYVGDISNMPLTLTVEVNLLQGTLALNIPPAPTDRIWYGFRKDPTLSLAAAPKVGSREINLSAVVQMIERKLKLAFKRAIVMPHMDDLIIPIMFTPVYDE